MNMTIKLLKLKKCNNKENVIAENADSRFCEHDTKNIIVFRVVAEFVNKQTIVKNVKEGM
jgi:hypothetical protein